MREMLMSCSCLDANASHKLGTSTQERGSAEIEASSSNPNGNLEKRGDIFPALWNNAPNLPNAECACPGQLPRPDTSLS